MSGPQEALGTFSYGVYVATCKAGEKINGITLAWVSQVSQKPPRLMIAANKASCSHALMSDSAHFIVHVLADDQVELGKHFGSTHGWDLDKFDGVEWTLGVDGIPILKGCRAVLVCKKTDQVDGGDHSMFIGEVISDEVDAGKKEQVLDRKAYFG